MNTEHEKNMTPNTDEIMYFIVEIPTLYEKMGFKMKRSGTFAKMIAILSSMSISPFDLYYKSIEIKEHTRVESIVRGINHKPKPTTKTHAVKLQLKPQPPSQPIIWTTERKAEDLRRAISLRHQQQQILEEQTILPQEVLSHIFSYVPYEIQYDMDKKYRPYKQTKWHEMI
jgi:hypothetical protein